MRNFIAQPSEYDYSVAIREINGRMTKKRYETIRDWARRYNYNNSALYGISPNGYAYTCGCSHDCCGCVSGRYASLSISNNNATITITETYNY